MTRIRRTLDISETDLWYLVGLVATDGCLSSDGRHINITSKDHDFLGKLNDRLDLCHSIGIKNKKKKNQAYYLEFSNKNLYDFLMKIGLTPNKSLTMGKLEIKDKFFPEFLRGVIDGDGSIRNWIHPSNGIEQWSLRVYSASKSFVEWLSAEIERQIFVKGRIHENSKNKKNSLYVLKFGKLAAKKILGYCYRKSALQLDRKARLAEECRVSGTGWAKSKVIVNAS